jgi:hypothetical protein
VTWRDAVLYGPGWAACILLILSKPIDRWHYRRTCRLYRERWGVDYDGP